MYEIEQNIFRLNVSMNDKFLMNVIDTLNDLFDDPAYFRLFHSSVFSQHLKQLSACAILYKQVDVLLVLEVSIERGDVSMCEIELNT